MSDVRDEKPVQLYRVVRDDDGIEVIVDKHLSQTNAEFVLCRELQSGPCDAWIEEE